VTYGPDGRFRVARGAILAPMATAIIDAGIAESFLGANARRVFRR
jgi:hypothetical protein